MKTEAYSHNMTTWFYCWLCGGQHRQDNSAVRLVDGQTMVGELCPDCVTAGPAGAAERAREYARELRAAADAIDAVAERLPEASPWATMDEWEAAARAAWADTESAV